MELLSIDYISGFFDGEGCVTISTHLRKGRNSLEKTPAITPMIIITQKKPLILVKIQESLKELGITSIFWTQKDSCSRLRVTGISNILDFCNLMIPFTYCKRSELELMKEYCEHRLSQKVGKKHSLPYTEVDFAYIENLRELK